MKKEQYFTAENMSIKTKELKAELELDFKHPRFEFSFQNTALLVLDMQKYFSNSLSHACVPSFSAIVPNINKLIKDFKKNNLPVIFTRHVNTHKNAGLMAQWWREIILEENKNSLVVEDFDTSKNVIIKKTQYDAFYKTELERILIQNNIQNLVITGVMTHLCCETTARTAFVKGYKTFFVIDATATYNETLHKNSIMNLAHGFSVPVITQDIISTCFSNF